MLNIIILSGDAHSQYTSLVSFSLTVLFTCVLNVVSVLD